MPNFCSACGARLEERPAFGKVRPVCPACGQVHFEDPKVAVGVVAEREGQILLTRRNHEPKMGCWSFPSGFVDAYENVVEAAVREAFEETGIRVTVGPLLGVYQEPGSRVIYLAFAAEAGPGEPVCGEECMEVRFFPADALPELAFHHDAAILAAWRRSRSSREERGMRREA
jgi:8-oxo-dGTP diphosphatase